MSGTGWYTTEHDIKSGKKGLQSWAKETGGVVMTSLGVSVDFHSRNFDAKHLCIVPDSTSYNALLSAGRTRQIGRKTGTIPGVKSSTSSILVMPRGQLAAWGADIAKKQRGMTGPNSTFQGTPQWIIGSELKAAAFLTHKHNVGSPLTSGIGAFVTVCCVMPTTNAIQVVHFEANHTGLLGTGHSVRTVTTPSNQNVVDNTEINKKRIERFNRGIAADNDTFDLSELFG